MTSIYQAEGNHRLTTSISKEAYQVLADCASPRTMGRFLSELLVAYSKKRTLTQRVEQLEATVQQFQAHRPRSTVAERVEAKRIAAEMEAGDYVTDEPQLIYRGNQMVAAVVQGKIFSEFLTWCKETDSIHVEPNGNNSTENALQELHRLCLEEEYTLEVPPRRDRPNAFLEVLEEESELYDISM